MDLKREMYAYAGAYSGAYMGTMSSGGLTPPGGHHQVIPAPAPLPPTQGTPNSASQAGGQNSVKRRLVTRECQMRTSFVSSTPLLRFSYGMVENK